MDFISILEKKRDGLNLNDEEIDFVVKKIVDGSLPDYQLSAFLMATYINGMTDEETYNLTMSMVNNGSVEYIEGISDRSVDKHSTGGVGDKLTLVITPILAAYGVPVVKMSGRGLGITGGTLDKLESIPGFNIYLSQEDIEKQAEAIGIVLAAQTNNLAPADKVIYALRDVTATIDSYPLIASSIMSKKLAIKNKALCIDLKVGKGAFMKDLESASELARIFKFIADKNKRDISVVLTDMNNPIGRCVGNSLEIMEVVDVLKGKLKEEVYDMSIRFAAESIQLLYPRKSIEEITKECELLIDDGSAYNKFLELVKWQGGETSFLDNIEESLSKNKFDVLAASEGYVDYDAHSIGYISLICGAGRKTKEDAIDHGAGIKFNKVHGDKVNKGDLLYSIYTEKNFNDIEDYIKGSFELLKNKQSTDRILKVI
ncbi:thymidine phosphorylase [uncultured Ezakiella sp.]|uniref:thymidine phosphorylase n=1 Tax=uncultured Ezakiella sp. TaxID=1637529 RepID=UPI0025F8D1D1|nr:thymidine phosphorylase [uncultured Ezakiella sp.]